jgi:hypothetical protein
MTQGGTVPASGNEGSINGQLNALFDAWRQPLSPAEVAAFSADGVIRETEFIRQARRILFVLMEPNSVGSTYLGRDLREVWQEPLDERSFNWNIGLWTQALLSGRTDFGPISAQLAYSEFQRVAIMNLKKHAWQDRVFIRSQVDAIAPDVVVCGSWDSYNLFHQVSKDDPVVGTPAPGWHRDGDRTILYTYHPATRNGTQATEAFRQLLSRSRDAGLITTGGPYDGPSNRS